MCPVLAPICIYFTFFNIYIHVWNVYAMIDKNPKNTFTEEHILFLSKSFEKYKFYTREPSVIKKVLIVFYNNTLLNLVIDTYL